jgi:hypothetical protein
MSSIFCGIHRTITKAMTDDTYELGMFFPIPFLSVTLLYGFYPLKYHHDDYFKKKGHRNSIAEYGFVKNVLYVGLPLMVFFASIYYILSIRGLTTTVNLGPLLQVVYFPQVSLQYSVTAGALWMLSQLIRKEFRYYLAKAYIKSALDSDDDSKKLNLLIIAVNSYNKYLVRFLQIQINVLRLCDALVVKSNELIDGHIKSLSESFDDRDKLMPARRISQIMNMNSSEEFFAKQSFSTVIITWGTLIGTILTIAVSIFQLVTPSTKP